MKLALNDYSRKGSVTKPVVNYSMGEHGLYRERERLFVCVCVCVRFLTVAIARRRRHLTCVSRVHVQPNVVFVADRTQFFQTIESASARRAQSGDHVTRNQPFADILRNGFGQYRSGQSAVFVGREQSHRHGPEETGFLDAGIRLVCRQSQYSVN